MTEAIHWYKASCDSQNEVIYLLNNKLNPVLSQLILIPIVASIPPCLLLGIGMGTSI